MAQVADRVSRTAKIAAGRRKYDERRPAAVPHDHSTVLAPPLEVKVGNAVPVEESLDAVNILVATHA
jgi:hypothetical protein